MPTRLCLEPRCPNVATANGRCEEHRKQHGRERSARRRTGERTARASRSTTRPSGANAREVVLTRDPICKVCDNALSEQVDHIEPLSQGGAEYALTNLRGICVPCHATTSARESIAAHGDGR